MHIIVSLLLIHSLFFSLFLTTVSAADKGANKIFTVGVLSGKPKRSIRNATPLLDYISEKLPGHIKGEVLVTNSLNEIADMLESGVISMVAVTPYAALLIERQSNAKVAAIRWKQGVGSYHSVMFSHKQGEINDLNDLVGRSIAFEKASSTSGFFMPSAYLLNKGFELQRLNSMTEKPEPNKIGYFFINDILRQSNEVNMSIGVFMKRLDAAAFSNLDWEDHEVTPLKVQSDLHILAETDPYPRSIVLTSPTLSKATEKALLDILFNAEKNKNGIEAMLKFKKTSRFSPISRDELALLEQVRLLLQHNFWLYNNAG